MTIQKLGGRVFIVLASLALVVCCKAEDYYYTVHNASGFYVGIGTDDSGGTCIINPGTTMQIMRHDPSYQVWAYYYADTNELLTSSYSAVYENIFGSSTNASDFYFYGNTPNQANAEYTERVNGKENKLHSFSAGASLGFMMLGTGWCIRLSRKPEKTLTDI